MSRSSSRDDNASSNRWKPRGVSPILPDAATPAGVVGRMRSRTGGIAALNHRLIAVTPPAYKKARCKTAASIDQIRLLILRFLARKILFIHRVLNLTIGAWRII